MTKEELKDMLVAYGEVCARFRERMMNVEKRYMNRHKDPECQRLKARREELGDTILKEFESLNSGSLLFFIFTKNMHYYETDLGV